jgi:hypothetical protein
MSHAVISVELAEPVMQDASAIAEKNGMSVADWISVAVTEKLQNERLTAEFYRRRDAGGDGKALLEMLAKAPDREPDPGDEL